MEDEEEWGHLPPVRQEVDDTLVAVVEILLLLELLKRVKAEVDVPALEVVLIELRQFPETMELALEATGRPELRVLLGETPRSGRLSPKAHVSKELGLVDRLKTGDFPVDFMGLGEPLARRPLVQVEDVSSALENAVE